MTAIAEIQPYLALKLSRALYQKSPDSLEPGERQRLDAVVERQWKIEQRILASPETAQVVLPASSMDKAMAEIRARYASDDEFHADLERAGLDRDGLIAAIERDLKSDAVLDRIASKIVNVSETDIEIFYLMHRERFLCRENRTLRHILVTINEELNSNERATARRKIDNIRARLLKAPERFAELAMKHSECPTSMEGGFLGVVEKGQLYPELEDVAFAMSIGELSRVVESPMGFHLINCVSIQSSSEQPLSQVRDKIREHLFESRRQAAQREWIAGLFRKAG